MELGNFGFNNTGGGGGGGTIGGGGTLNYICKFTPDGTNIGDSQMFDNGTSVGLGTITPDVSAILDLTSTTQGFLTPRMTTLERNAIVAPATGLLIYNTGTSLFEYFDGVIWQQIDSNATSEWLLDGNTNGALRYIGTNDTFDFPIYTDGSERARFLASNGNFGINDIAPAEKLTVEGNIAPTTTGIRTLGTTTLRWLTLYLASSIDYATDLTWVNSASTKMTLTTTGNLGIGVAPTARLHAQGSGNTSATFSFRADNSDAINYFNVRDDGAVNVFGGNGLDSSFSVRGHKTSGFIVDMYNNNSSRAFMRMNETGEGVGTTGYVEIMLHSGTVACITAYDYLNTTPRIGFGSHFSGDGALLNSRNDIQTVGSDAFMQWTNTLSYLSFDSDKGAGYANPFLIMDTNAGAGDIGQVKIQSYGDSYFNGGQVAIAPFGFSTPTAMLHLRGIDATIANYVFKAQDNVGTDLFNVRNEGSVGVGILASVGKFHTFGMLSNVNQRLEPVSGVREDVSGATVNTTDATTTTLQTIAVPTDTVLLIESRVTARKTAGAGTGTIGDGNGYIRTVKAKNVGGVVTIGSVQASFTSEDIASFTATFSVSGTNVRLRIGGSANNDVTWNTITRIENVS